MSCYYCTHNIKDEKCEFDIEGYPLPSDIECRHFWFDTGEEDHSCSDTPTEELKNEK